MDRTQQPEELFNESPENYPWSPMPAREGQLTGADSEKQKRAVCKAMEEKAKEEMKKKISAILEPAGL